MEPTQLLTEYERRQDAPAWSYTPIDLPYCWFGYAIGSRSRIDFSSSEEATAFFNYAATDGVPLSSNFTVVYGDPQISDITMKIPQASSSRVTFSPTPPVPDDSGARSTQLCLPVVIFSLIVGVIAHHTIDATMI